MPVILTVERKSLKARVFLALVYSVLALGGVTMVVPFLVMLASSLTGPYDYYRFSPVVRAVWDRNDRFVRYVATCYPSFPFAVYPDAPPHWGSWVAVSRDEAGSRAFAARELAAMRDPATAAQWQRRAADYADFNLHYDIRNSECNFDARDVAGFVRRHFEGRVRDENPAAFAKLSTAQRRDAALDLLNREWVIRYPTFFGIRMIAQQRAPLNHANWDYPTDDPKSDLYQDFKRSYKTRAAPDSPMTRTVPFESRQMWLKHLKAPDTQQRLGFAVDNAFTPADYAALSGEPCESFANLPFPLIPNSSFLIPNSLYEEWSRFIHERYPRRLLRVRVTPGLEERYRAYVRDTCKSEAVYTQLTGRAIDSFADVRLMPYENSALWRNFIPHVPLGDLDVLSAEQAWQDYLLAKYGTAEEVCRAYGWRRIEEARLPVREAIAVTFARRGWRDFAAGTLANYRMVGEYLFLRGAAFGNTLLLVILSILATLTVNPLAAYALSRLGMRRAEKILLFMLATMAFPAAVTAIPGFLLIRDLGLLNTFAALVLPTVASGMSIFILKGFFDALPRELYEAAMIDGAKEWQVFLRITLPMTTPILAVNALHAFVHAYNSWEWALLVCQRPSHWTLAVWMYQMSQQLGDQPWAVMAGFVIVSLPTAVVFILCQKIILRGIVLPSMK
ncbi:MAG: carbohydrate ABC transporter permease [Kiritimatiellaeota bacterium]|nr:carbohydrate ABC transporter permease [Kiritimatiellota bacterium]